MSLTTKSINFAITKAPQVLGISSGAVSKTAASIFSSTPVRTVYQASATGVTQGINQLTRHGLEEIVVEARLLDKGGMITNEGARISHPAPVGALYPDAPHVIVEGRVFYYQDKVGINRNAVKHEITRLSNGDIKIKFFDKTGAYTVETIKYDPKTRPIRDKDEIKKLLEEAHKKPPKVQDTELPEITEPHFLGFKKPNGTTSCQRVQTEANRSTIYFRDKDGKLLREIQCDKNGYPIEYTNYEYTYENISGRITYGPNGEHIPLQGKCQYDEVVKKSTYRINDTEVLSTTQIKEVTPHNYAQTGSTMRTTVERRGNFEEVTIESGDKRINEFFVRTSATHKARLAGTHAKGLTKEEIELIQSDPYLSSRYYNDGVEFIESIKPTIFGQEGIRYPEFTRFTFEPPVKSEGGCYTPKPIGWGKTERVGGIINVVPHNVNATNKAHTVNVTAHETRHGHQFDIIEDGMNGKLVGKEKDFADKLQYASDHYTHPDVDRDAYWNNLMEVDARQAGENAERIFNQHSEEQRKIFTA